MRDLQSIIEDIFAKKESLSSKNIEPNALEAIQEVIQGLEDGKLRAAEKINNAWITHEWIKKAILLHFLIYDNELISTKFSNFYDKLPLQYSNASETIFKDKNIRIVPPACVRKGAYIGRNTILMPSCVNIGAYVDDGCMIDTWATVGSCAQIGKNVHISGGSGIGGVLEPLQASPTIIEDNCFIGARSEIVEGVIVEEGAVVSMGVFIGQSTKIYDRTKNEITYGRVPAGSVVVPGILPSKDNRYGLYCAVIVKQVDERTKKKVGINELLRATE